MRRKQCMIGLLMAVLIPISDSYKDRVQQYLEERTLS